MLRQADAGAFSGHRCAGPDYRRFEPRSIPAVVDVVFVTGDAYVDHPSFAAALLCRLLESEGFRVAVLSQPDWHSCEPWRRYGRPRLCFAIGAGNMDSMVNHYTANRKVRNTDAYSPGGQIGRRPDRATIVYCQRAREAYRDVPIVCGGVEASLRRLAHYDYWSDKIRRSIILDAKADLLVYGMGERALVEIAHRLAAGEPVKKLRDIRGVAYRLGATERLPAAHYAPLRPLVSDGSAEGSKRGPIDRPTTVPALSPGHAASGTCASELAVPPGDSPVFGSDSRRPDTIVLPSFEEVVSDKRAFARMTRLAHLETNPYNARRLVQYHGSQAVVINPPQYPLTQAEMDRIYGLPFTRRPDPSYGDQPIPAYEVVKNSVQIVRGCFGGCTFCSLAAHQGKIVQSRSARSVLAEVRRLAKEEDFSGTISDLGGPTANMYAMGCSRPEVQQRCRRASCLHPAVCKLLRVDHGPLIRLMKQVRKQAGVRKVLVASGIRMDLALRSRAYLNHLVRHHVGGHLKVAPEHTHPEVLRLMKKPSVDVFEQFACRFRELSVRSGKQQFLVPYFMAGHPGCDLEAMVHLAQFLKRTGYRPQQVQDFIPVPFDVATAMYYTGIDPMTEQPVYVPRGERQRRLQRALLQFWKPENYFLVRRALEQVGRTDLIGNGPQCLIGSRPPAEARQAARGRQQGRSGPGGRKPRSRTRRRQQRPGGTSPG